MTAKLNAHHFINWAHWLLSVNYSKLSIENASNSTLLQITKYRAHQLFQSYGMYFVEIANAIITCQYNVVLYSTNL